MSMYDIEVRDNSGRTLGMDEYAGKVLLIVNTATKCGFTPQYWALESLYKKYRDRGFEVLDFPCNQFFAQAPGADSQIDETCKIKYGTTFPRFSKVEVNGRNAHPLFVHLKRHAADTGDDSAGSVRPGGVLRALRARVMNDDIKWNFTKFLVDREGRVVARFGPTVKPEQIEDEIRSLL